jgi:NAD dependent epimerase/dehydratase
LSDYRGKRVFVTGADGFIGSQLTEELVRRGATVRALVNYNSFGHFGWLDELPADVLAEIEVVSGDERDASQMLALVGGRDVVFHLAALIAIPYSYEAPRSYLSTNVEGTLNVLEACRTANVSRLVHTSTSEVFGTARYVPIDEAHPRTGQSPYAATKIAADALVESYHLTWRLPAIIVRPFNTYGPRQSARAIIPTVISQIAAGRTVVEVGSITPTRDFLFVRDTAAAFAVAGLAPGLEGESFNAGTGVEISIGDLITKIAALMGVTVEVRETAERKRPESSEVFRLLADARKLRERTGWAPAFSLEAGLTETIAWIRAHLDRYRPGAYTR